MTRDDSNFEIGFFEKLVADDPNFINALIPLAELYTRKGLDEKALELDLRISKLRPQDDIAHYNLACSLALAGRKEEALKALKRAADLGYTDFRHMKKDPDLQSLREDPRFQAIVSSHLF